MQENRVAAPATQRCSIAADRFGERTPPDGKRGGIRGKGGGEERRKGENMSGKERNKGRSGEIGD